MRRLVIGDIHGCRRELLELLSRFGPAPDDEIIAIGDVVDRGPESSAIVDFVRSAPQIRVLMGNHEHKHLCVFKGKAAPSFSQAHARRQFSPEAYANAIAFSWWTRHVATERR